MKNKIRDLIKRNENQDLSIRCGYSVGKKYTRFTKYAILESEGLIWDQNAAEGHSVTMRAPSALQVFICFKTGKIKQGGGQTQLLQFDQSRVKQSIASDRKHQNLLLKRKAK